MEDQDMVDAARAAAAGADSYGSPHFEGYHDSVLGMQERLARTGIKFKRKMDAASAAMEKKPKKGEGVEAGGDEEGGDSDGEE
jgi:hypothetical protein